MEKKKFNRGTISGGIARILIALVAIIIGIIILSTKINSWDADDAVGGVFLCVIASIIIIASVAFIFNGAKMIIDGKKSLEVSKKGHPENGKIVDLFETEVTENNNGCVSHYTIYNLKFEYTDDYGNLCESKEQISGNAYEKLQGKTFAPILVYGERAIFDKKQLENDIIEQ